ncbi:MAG: PKD domain-containing protein [Gemmataceae bacterium]|nr:PKD domain-containing protein [Gemmataceae bacterium]MCI0743390.1 PKD domain-containing protein [Gemmataceae bacterium]
MSLFEDALKSIHSVVTTTKRKFKKRKTSINSHLDVESLEAREVPVTGLVAAYNFDQGAGTVLTDVSGNNNNGTIINATWSSTAQSGQSLYFNGVDATVRIADSASLDLTNGMTLEAWIRPKDISNWRSVLLKEGDQTLSYGLYANGDGARKNTPALYAYNGESFNALRGTSTIRTGRWTHLAGTYDGSTLRLYVNGVLVGTRAVTGNLIVSNGALTIGGNSVWGEFFKGNIDDVRVYNRALTQSEIQTDMNTPVQAEFSVSAGPDKTGNEGASVTFNAAVQGGSGPYTFQWNFGDGTTSSPSSSPTINHTYADNGTYTATLSVTDFFGLVGTDTALVTVNNAAPSSLNLTRSAASIDENNTLTLNGSFADPGTLDTHSVVIQWGDGTSTTLNLAANVTTFSANHLYADNPADQANGSFNIQVSVKDNSNAQTTASTSVQVVNQAPSNLTLTRSATSIDENNSLTLDGSFADAGTLDTHQVVIQWGDGTSSTLNLAANVTTFSANHVFLDNPAGQANGSFTIQVEVKDKENAQTSTSTSVQVNNVAPTGSSGGPYEGNAGQSIAFASTVSDPSPTDTSAGFTYLWDFGDGSTSDQVSPSHAFAAAGTYTVTLKITDKDGGSYYGSTTATITAVDAPPTVTSVTPASGATGVALGSNITVVFSEAMDSASINSGTVRLKDAAGNVLTGAVSYISANNSATIDPANDLAFSSGYTIEVLGGASGVKDAAGTAMAATFTSSFTTVADAAPSVTSVTPASGTTGVAVGSNITVVFSEAMDAASINSSTVRLKNSAGNVLSASVSYNSTNNTATIDPANSLTFSTSYSVEVLGGASGVKDAVGTAMAATFTSAFTTAADPNAQFIVTPYDKIPNFGANPTIVSLHSGNWSDPATWGGRLPGAGDIVSIASTFTVTYDVVSDAALNTVVVQAGGKLIFRTDVSTRLTVVNFLVLEGGELTIGTEANPVAANVKAEVVFANIPLNTALDPSQYGNGLIALGEVTMHGAVKSDTFVRLAVEPKVGDTTLTLSEPVTGWRVGDRLVLPDTRHLIGGERWSQYTPQWEVLTIQAISADGRTLTLSSPLSFDHIGARNGDGVLEFLPHVGNLTRNIVVRSQSATGTRGYAMFTQRADVDIRYAQFAGLGRTSQQNFDNTTYDIAGNVTHVGTNQAGRYPVYFNHLIGPTTSPQNGYQYTFMGNSVTCPLDPMPFRWGITVNDSHYGLISDNVLYNWAGAGIVTEAGNESFNVFQRNFVVATRGDASPRSNDGRDGSAFWFHGFNNRLIDNVAADSVGAAQGIVAGSGFNLFAPPGASANYRIPLFPGADVQIPGQYQLVDMNLIPILQFTGNETYGATATGMTIWHLGTDGYAPTNVGQSVIEDFRAWHVWEEGFFGYPIHNVTFDGFVVRGHSRALNQYDGGTGWTSGDYWAGNVTIRNADVQGMYWGGVSGSTNTPGTFRIENSFFRNYVANIVIQTLSTPGARAPMPARQTIIDNVRFAPYAGAPAFQTIVMNFNPNHASTNFIQKDEVFVYNYNGVAGDNFQLYYREQRPDFIVPQTTYYGPDNNGDGIGDWIDNLGAPLAGLTNQQAWDLFGIAIGGAVAPTSATRTNIVGYVRAF